MEGLGSIEAELWNGKGREDGGALGEARCGGARGSKAFAASGVAALDRSKHRHANSRAVAGEASGEDLKEPPERWIAVGMMPGRDINGEMLQRSHPDNCRGVGQANRGAGSLVRLPNFHPQTKEDSSLGF